jgi:hypothetical protein
MDAMLSTIATEMRERMIKGSVRIAPAFSSFPQIAPL